MLLKTLFILCEIAIVAAMTAPVAILWARGIDRHKDDDGDDIDFP